MANILRWTNKYSNEQGYVKCIAKANGYFENTFDAAEAKVYKRQCDITKALNTLEALGECENNIFEAVEV